jgi:hypothetical protein
LTNTGALLQLPGLLALLGLLELLAPLSPARRRRLTVLLRRTGLQNRLLHNRRTTRCFTMMSQNQSQRPMSQRLTKNRKRRS